MLKNFWKWYNKHLGVNITIAAGLFVLQLVHLTWLTLHVVLFKLTGHSFWDPNAFWQSVIILVDYTEIPALFATSLVYINEIRQKGFKIKPAWYLFSLNIQLLHMFWITDEFVVTTFSGGAAPVNIPAWLAWVAIMIDYLELPVIFETLGKSWVFLKKESFQSIT